MTPKNRLDLAAGISLDYLLYLFVQTLMSVQTDNTIVTMPGELFATTLLDRTFVVVVRVTAEKKANTVKVSKMVMKTVRGDAMMNKFSIFK